MLKVIRTSNKRNSGSRRNKHHKFVPSRISDTRHGHWDDEVYVVYGSHDYMSKPNHAARYTDIKDCFQPMKFGHL